jgi:hypothetical protein
MAIHEQKSLNPTWLNPPKAELKAPRIVFAEQRTEIPTNEQLVGELIHLRKTQVAQMNRRYRPKINFFPEPPECDMNSTLRVIFSADPLWTFVDGARYIPDSVVKACIRHSDKEEESLHNLSVFYAMRRKSIRKRWNIYPQAAPEKTRFQYWDEPYVRTLFASIQTDLASPQTHFNHIAHRIRPDVSLSELFQVKLITENHLMRVIQSSSEPVYQLVRDKWNAYFDPPPFSQEHIDLANY